MWEVNINHVFLMFAAILRIGSLFELPKKEIKLIYEILIWNHIVLISVQQKPVYFISSSTDLWCMVHVFQAVHPFNNESEKELSFSKGDFVVVRMCVFISSSYYIFM